MDLNDMLKFNNQSYQIGDRGPAGGWIFYDKGFYSDGWRYLEVAPEDMTDDATREFMFGYYRTSPDGDNLFVNGTTYVEGTSDPDDGKSTGTAIGTGKANTAKLVDKMGSTAYTSFSVWITTTTDAYAAKLCYDYSYGGYDDWFLPSKDELNLMYETLQGRKYGFDTVHYWSSSEGSYNAGYAWCQRFDNGFQYTDCRDDHLRVRAVRAF